MSVYSKSKRKLKSRSRAPSVSSGKGEALYGVNPVEAALRARRRSLKSLHLRSGPLSGKLSLLHELALERNLPIGDHRPAELEALCQSSHHQGAVLRCGPLPLLDEGEALAGTATSGREGGAPPLLVALDQVEDPQNFGAIVRCCSAFHVSGLVIPRDHSAPPSPAASSASAGALETFPVHRIANLARFLSAGKKRNYWVAGTVVEGGESLPKFNQEGPLILVVGNEGRGLRPLVIRHCDFLLTIPLPGEAPDGSNPSLNVATAVAVVLYQLRAAGGKLGK